MSDLLHLFEENIREKNLFQPADLLLLAVSGGIDSVVLCELCSQAGFNFVIAHCNFQLRGEESERDQRFVEALAQKNKIRLFVKRFDTREHVLKNNTSVQVAARELRYQWFSELADALKEETRSEVYILTAHHANDNVETVLMNFFKGTGVAGMRGMLSKTDAIVRPLLFAPKQKLMDFAKEMQLAFVEDSSNASDKYYRNYVRNQVLPFIQKIYPGVQANIISNIDRFCEIELLYNQAIMAHKKKLIEVRNNEVYISVLKLLKAIPLKTVVFEIIKAYGFTAKQTGEVISLLYAETGKFIRSTTHRVLRNRNWLIISPLPQSGSEVIVIDENNKEVIFENGKLTLKIVEVGDEKQQIPVSPAIACLDIKQLTFPLLLRKWKAGDYFYPLGMKKKKKLSRFFIDQKLSLLEKENIWVVEMNKKIIWVINNRIDERFKLLPTSKAMLQIELKVGKV